MLERSLLPLGLCALLCACGGNYPKKSNVCAADGGCTEPATCSDKTCADAATGGTGGDHAARAGSSASTRTQAMRVALDAGTESQQDGDAATADRDEPAQPDKPSKQNAAGASAAKGGMKSSKSGQGGAGGSMSQPAKKDKPAQQGQGGAGGQAGANREEPGSSAEAEQAACDPSCGPCQACDEQKSCQPVTGQDDADSCSETRSCSSRGECLHISEAQADLGSMQDYAELSQSYAQVLTFIEPATIQEIRLEVSCNENDQSFPAVWIAAAPGGIPSDNIIATANVIYQAPSDTNTFALLELSKTLEEPATGPIAIVVSKSDMSCIVRLNKQSPYPNGNLFTLIASLWTPAEGSMVFQVLSSQ